MRSITTCTEESLRGKRVLVRVGFDVPVDGGVVQNDFRIREALATIAYLTDAGAKVVLLSHIGRDPNETLEPVYAVLKRYMRVSWMPKLVGDDVRTAIDALANGDAILLENLRGHEGETANDPLLAKELASYGDLYVNEAFSVAHRTHASIVGIPALLPSYAGIGFMKEAEELAKAFTPTSPSVFVIGGAKFDTKLPLIKKFMGLYEHVFVCGALAHDVWEARGVSVGGSLTSDVPITDRDIIDSEKVVLPIDVRVQSLDGRAQVIHPKQLGPADIIMDAGPESVERMLGVLAKGGTLLWNGPLGFYERGFTDATMAFAEGAALSGARTIVGGGDTIAAIEKLGLNDRFTHLSTAGGAMLEFLEKGTLPGIEVLA